MEAPCGACKRKGCGTYHSQCPEYQLYRQEKEKARRKKDREMDITQALFEQKDKAIRQKLHGRRSI